MKTVTYDETQWKLVPIEPTDKMASLAEGWIDAAERGEPVDLIDMVMSIIEAAPPYPDQSEQALNMVDSAAHDIRNFGQSWAVRTFENGVVKTKDIPLSDILVALPSAPKGEE